MTEHTTLKLPPLPAMPLPDGTLYGPDRTVRGHPFLPAKVRAYAELYGQLCLDIAEATAAPRIAALRAGNTALLEALMDMVHQYVAISDDLDAVFNHTHMACEESAMRVLIGAGMAEEVDGGYRLLWAKLEERKPKQQAWADAVDAATDDPAERVRLKALDDNPAAP